MENEGVDITENKFNESGHTVTNVGIEMPFSCLLTFMINLAIAAIPATFIPGLILFL